MDKTNRKLGRIPMNDKVGTNKKKDGKQVYDCKEKREQEKR